MISIFSESVHTKVPCTANNSNFELWQPYPAPRTVVEGIFNVVTTTLSVIISAFVVSQVTLTYTTTDAACIYMRTSSRISTKQTFSQYGKANIYVQCTFKISLTFLYRTHCCCQLYLFWYNWSCEWNNVANRSWISGGPLSGQGLSETAA